MSDPTDSIQPNLAELCALAAFDLTFDTPVWTYRTPVSLTVHYSTECPATAYFVPTAGTVRSIRDRTEAGVKEKNCELCKNERPKVAVGATKATHLALYWLMSADTYLRDESDAHSFHGLVMNHEHLLTVRRQGETIEVPPPLRAAAAAAEQQLQDAEVRSQAAGGARRFAWEVATECVQAFLVYTNGDNRAKLCEVTELSTLDLDTFDTYHEWTLGRDKSVCPVSFDRLDRMATRALSRKVWVAMRLDISRSAYRPSIMMADHVVSHEGHVIGRVPYLWTQRGTDAEVLGPDHGYEPSDVVTAYTLGADGSGGPTLAELVEAAHAARG